MTDPFHPLSVRDIPMLTRYFARQDTRLCNASAGAAVLWQPYFQDAALELDGTLLLREQFPGLGTVFSTPIGERVGNAYDFLVKYCCEVGKPLQFFPATASDVENLRARFGAVEVTTVRNWFDYLYDAQDMVTFRGRRFNGQRNHIHRLDEACPGWTWAPLTQADIPACLAMDAAWHQDALTRETVRGLSTLDDEHRALGLALEHLPALGLEGIVLRWQDTLLGFTLGAPLTETIFDVHFERARGEIQGAYPAVNRSFARYIRQKYPHIRYLDREDDMGLPGLRKAKLSYAPDYLQVNFSAVECRAP